MHQNLNELLTTQSVLSLLGPSLTLLKPFPQAPELLPTCQGPASACRGVLREGVSGSSKSKWLEVKAWIWAGVRPALLETAWLSSLLFSLFCFLSFWSAFSRDLLSLESSKQLSIYILLETILQEVLSCLSKSFSLDSSSPVGHKPSLLFYISIQSFTLGFLLIILRTSILCPQPLIS